MSEVAAPPPVGPPPPKVPEGWKVQWNEQYSEWFYVNIYTKKSQWEKPTEPVYPPSESVAPPPDAPPPGYTPASSSAGGTPAHDIPTDHKINPYETKSTPNLNAAGSSTETDEEIARRLQAEEDARGSTTRGNAQQDYMNTPMPGYQQSNSPYPPQGGSPFSPPQQSYGQQGSSYPSELPPREQKKGGFLGKLLGKASGSSSGSGYRPQGGGYPPQQQYPQQYPQQQYYGGPQQYGGYPPQGYGQPGMMGGGYGRPMAPGKKPGGLGVGGAAALGVGGGLLGGAMLANAFDDDDSYRDGYQDAMQDQGDYGGGDDFAGGDF